MSISPNPPFDSETSTKLPSQLQSYILRTDSPKLSWYRSGGLLNERKSHRVAFPETLRVTGLEKNTDSGEFVAVSDSIIARGRDISVGGISFRHEETLPHRFVAVSFHMPFGMQTLVAQLLWCRFTWEEHYISGGNLIVDTQFNFELNID
jgi:hypothetical protein